MCVSPDGYTSMLIVEDERLDKLNEITSFAPSSFLHILITLARTGVVDQTNKDFPETC